MTAGDPWCTAGVRSRSLEDPTPTRAVTATASLAGVVVPPLRVAFDVGPLATPLTGVGQATRGMLEALGEHSAEVDLEPYFLSWRAPAPLEARRLPVPAAVAHRWWARHRRPRLDRWLHSPGSRRVDVIHGTNYVVPPARAARVVSVYDCWFLRHLDEVHPDVARAATVLRRAVHQGAIVHTSSRATADAVRELFGDVPVAVIALGAPEPSVVPAATPPAVHHLEGGRFVLALGTLERRKNLVRLVEAFARVAGERPDLRLVLAGGPGDDEVAIDEARSGLPAALAARIHRLGRVDEATKSWLLDRAAVLAYPSLDEGFGFPLLEAMQAATPVVASRVGSIPEVAQDAARYHDPVDVDDLAAALTAVLDDADEATRLRAAGTRRVAAHPWSATASGLLALYARAAMEGGAR